ncbi:Cubilin [Holothuria leucospilota]|uniref:Cubilin n=1 Tax=Holothuria leucospilota TaxID=206669 RepID=A0A9Q1BTA7_HOLLE|nr:Cubilin [Holothuria leucospilota]
MVYLRGFFTCIVQHTEGSDTFTSAQYPDTGTVDDSWEITVDQKHQILLQFLDFSLNETTSCTADVLELYNGDRFDNVLIDRFCWDDATVLTSTAYVSTGHQLYMRLITAEGYSRKGFRAHYTSVDLQHTNSSGKITSPGYPNTGHPLDEAWRIKVNEGFVVGILAVVVFTVFVIAIIVWKFKIKKAKSSPPTGQAIQSQMAGNPGTYEDVNLQKNAINRASLETSHEKKSVMNLSTTAYVEPCCIVPHTDKSGTITSSQYPGTGAVNDAWEITVDQGHQILLQFLDFSLNETTSCTVDVLELYNGGESDNVLIDRFCWKDATVLASTAYVSTGNQLYVRLKTADGYSRKGFRAQYTSGKCHRKI